MSTIIVQLLFIISISLFLFLTFLYFGDKKWYFAVISLCFLSIHMFLWEIFLEIDLLSELRISSTVFGLGILVAYETYFSNKYRSIFWISYVLSWVSSLHTSLLLMNIAPVVMPVLLTVYAYCYKVSVKRKKI